MALDKGLAIDDQEDTLWGRRGDALRRQKKFDEARTAYEKGLEIDPERESFKKRLAQLEEEQKAEGKADGGEASE